MQAEERLVRGAQTGDERALTELYEAYFDRIYRYVAVRIGNPSDAEDLTEDVFLKVLHSIGSFKWRGAPFSAWLFRIAHNLVVDYFRKASKRVTTPIDDVVLEGGADPEEAVSIKLKLEQLNAYMTQLTETQQQVMSLRFAGSLSVAETAKVMGKTEGAVKALQHSAVVTLRRRFAEG